MSDDARMADQREPLSLDEGFRLGDFEAQPRQGTLTRSGETLTEE